MKRLFFLTALAACLVIGLSLPASAKVTVGGEINFEWTYGYYTREWAGADAYFGLHNFTDNGGSTLSVEYASDDETFLVFMELNVYYQDNGNGVETSQAYMQYNAPSWSLMIGQMDSVSDLIGPSQALDQGAALEGYGNSTLDTHEQVRVVVGEKQRFIFALEAPYRGDIWGAGFTYYLFPGLTGAAELNFGNVLIHPWVHYEYVCNDTAGNLDHYNSADAGLELEGDFGLIGFAVGVNYGYNSSQNGVIISADPALRLSGKVNQGQPATQYGGWGELRIGGLALGAGIQAAWRPDWTQAAYQWGAFANYGIEFGLMTITPEVVLFNNGEDNTGADQGFEVLAGVVCSLAF